MFSWWLQSVGWGTGVGAGVWRTGFLVCKLKGLTRTLPLEILDHTQRFLALSLHLSSISISLSFPVIRANLLLLKSFLRIYTDTKQIEIWERNKNTLRKGSVQEKRPVVDFGVPRN